MLWLKQDFIFVPCLFKSVFTGGPLIPLWAWAAPVSPLTPRLPPEVLHRLSTQKSTQWGCAVHQNVRIHLLPLKCSLAAGEYRPLGGRRPWSSWRTEGWGECFCLAGPAGFARLRRAFWGLRGCSPPRCAPVLHFASLLLKVLRCPRRPSAAEPKLVCVCICAHVCLFPVCLPHHSSPRFARPTAGTGERVLLATWGCTCGHLIVALSTRTCWSSWPEPPPLVQGVCSQHRTCGRLSKGCSRARTRGSGRLEV